MIDRFFEFFRNFRKLNTIKRQVCDMLIIFAPQLKQNANYSSLIVVPDKSVQIRSLFQFHIIGKYCNL